MALIAGESALDDEDTAAAADDDGDLEADEVEAAAAGAVSALGEALTIVDILVGAVAPEDTNASTMIVS